MSHIGRSTIESAVIFIVFLAVCILASGPSLLKFERRYAQGTPQIIKSTRLPFRFSLRTLLIAVTLAAVGTALVTYAIR